MTPGRRRAAWICSEEEEEEEEEEDRGNFRAEAIRAENFSAIRAEKNVGH